MGKISLNPLFAADALQSEALTEDFFKKHLKEIKAETKERLHHILSKYHCFVAMKEVTPDRERVRAFNNLRHQKDNNSLESIFFKKDVPMLYKNAKKKWSKTYKKKTFLSMNLWVEEQLPLGVCGRPEDVSKKIFILELADFWREYSLSKPTIYPTEHDKFSPFANFYFDCLKIVFSSIAFDKNSEASFAQIVLSTPKKKQ